MPTVAPCSGVRVGAMGRALLAARRRAQTGGQEPDTQIADLVGAAAEPLPPIADEGFARFIDRYADAKVVLLGEATHGTDEFYRARTAITERLVREHGFSIVAVEADWPDAARIDAYIRNRAPLPPATTPFHRFPAWMWRNRAVLDLVDRLRAFNDLKVDADRNVGFVGLDLYSLPSSMDAVVKFVARYDPEGLAEVRARYGCLAPWAEDPDTFGKLARTSALDSCAEEVASVIEDILKARLEHIGASDRAFHDALGNARVVAASAAYHRAMLEGSAASWNARDTHMADTLKAVLEARGPDAKAVVWAHNSHIGDARATGMGREGELNLGQLARETWGEAAVLIGFGTHDGTVTAASDWGARAQTMAVNPSLPESWEAVMHATGLDRFVLDLRGLAAPLQDALSGDRIERFIGVIYRPRTERPSHYAPATLAQQFDGYVWFDRTRAVEPLSTAKTRVMPEGHPFGS